jgi:hypothetical protein
MYKKIKQKKTKQKEKKKEKRKKKKEKRKKKKEKRKKKKEKRKKKTIKKRQNMKDRQATRYFFSFCFIFQINQYLVKQAKNKNKLCSLCKFFSLLKNSKKTYLELLFLLYKYLKIS